MQFLRVVNEELTSHRATRAYPGLRARHYAVIPLGARSGLIQWVDNVTPLFSVYRAWEQRTREAHALKAQSAAAAAAGGGGGGGGAARASPPPVADAPSLALTLAPTVTLA